jgi:uncharacterized Zn-binding protein involved in type VI secretion
MGLSDDALSGLSNIGRNEVNSLGSVLSTSVAPFQQAAAPPPEAPPGSSPPPSNPVRTVQKVAGGIMGLINLPLQLMNTGFAVATNFIAQALPSFPGAFLGCLYIGPPHIHMHPPNITPPNPVPIPLPSIGPVTLGTSVKVLINGMPAARVGDVGFAPTCGGIYPAFTVFMGSSKVFIGGMRAARMSDICRACQPDFGGPLREVAAAMAVAGNVVALAGVVADVVDAEQAPDPFVSAAMGMSAAMNAAQMTADAVALAITTAMGSDPAVPPIPGALILGAPNVLIGGFPMINFPNPALMLFEKILKGLKGRGPEQEQSGESETGCPTCGGGD